MKVHAIEITFPVAVDLPHSFCADLDSLLGEVCRAYEAEHPDRVMWPFGHGSKLLGNLFLVDDEHPTEFDDSVYSVEINERVRFDTEPYVRGDSDFIWTIAQMYKPFAPVVQRSERAAHNGYVVGSNPAGGTR